MGNALKKVFMTEWLYPADWLFPGFKIERKWDFTCYLLFKLILGISIVISIFLSIDAYFQLDVFIPKIPFYFDKAVFFERCSLFIAPLTWALIIIFYFKLRLSIDDIKQERIPYIAQREHLPGSKSSWISGYMVLLLISLVEVIQPSILPHYAAKFLNISEVYFGVFIFQLLSCFALAMLSAMLVHTLLMLEKIFRAFEDVKNSVELMGKTTKEDWL